MNSTTERRSTGYSSSRRRRGSSSASCIGSSCATNPIRRRSCSNRWPTNCGNTNGRSALSFERILGSQLFFSAHALGRKVRSPVDLAIGLLRSLEGTTNAHELAAELQQNGQGLFFPPNVKGWDGGRAWINSSTILGRANMMARVIGDDKTRFGGGKLDEYFGRLGASKPDEIIDVLVDLLLAVPLPPTVPRQPGRDLRQKRQSGARHRRSHPRARRVTGVSARLTNFRESQN